eukprot:2646730-Pyramimonas_sp.AAC.1
MPVQLWPPKRARPPGRSARPWGRGGTTGAGFPRPSPSKPISREVGGRHYSSSFSSAPSCFRLVAL